MPPAFIDLAPIWRPAAFALAIFANWIGPRQGDVSVLRHFDHIPDFDQLLLRAAIRMLLIMSSFREDWADFPERRATETVITRLTMPRLTNGAEIAWPSASLETIG
jgi:hypothetical protein